MKNLTKNIKRITLIVWNWITDVGYMFVGLWILLFRKITKPAIFRGHFHFKIAQRYAKKRHKNWKPIWDQLGRQQGIFPFNSTSLLVCSPLEMKFYQKKGIIETEKNYKKYFKVNYWCTAKTLTSYKHKLLSD